MTYIAYKGTANALVDLMSGQIAAFSANTADVVALHKSGKVRVLATAGDKREKLLPDIPTFKELGYNLEGTGWFGAYAPAKTPKDVVNRLSKSIIDALKAPDVRDRLEALGLEPTGLGPGELARIQKADYDKWGPIIKTSGFKPED
jgi:tripartite-type tricarboxylate transporter receptor subunit TctC